MNAAREEMEADPHVQHVRRLLGYADLEAVAFDTLVAIGMLASSMRERDAELERLRRVEAAALALVKAVDASGCQRGNAVRRLADALERRL